ncbi:MULTISPECIES: HlyD family type I secretion periplasmic adaptor subunit [unclassified Rhizobium]|jgi:adhesin transport system membrane fusion protein|uniref:HlyD family type I secretion periplasmic adaptor subunit n=1 Tax=unclassified Rhizobium TaxID=2613769 RepID=UPI001616D8F0|nr:MULTISPECIES: HlyD family type I secretion periplasmic adaptor subunit [unclassified Rhizobium]MBB3285271.1 adhesin transport system membrane fusion protein [Rhizobium sp. BK252]MBB3400010.1 adhesin transport system membrane fusion protein [Rhizobium sp. BK289]MBB3412590.1 adhesin transport system membrane fusion protein [Rhizobium sp. BK284]MBB3480476.1 adhesin transport system membrane fusion protein [Rhizobium sp. BK347]MDK4719148.1 HlyD family type I secretion periplasmic adaptor subuni
MMRASQRNIDDSPPLFARLILGLCALMIVAFVAWAAFADIDEIARGEGKVIPVSKTQIVQSSEPGIVQQINVNLGQVVHKGDILVQLDNTTTVSTLGESVAKARALGAKVERLALEEAGAFDAQFVCPADILATAKTVCDNEEKLFEADRASYKNKLDVLNQRLKQHQNELDEAHANIDRLTQNIEGAQKQYDLLKPLGEKKLVAQTEVLKVQRDLVDLQGQLKVYVESLDRLQAAVNEATLQVADLGLQLRQQALTDKGQALSELSVVDETIRGASDRVKHTDIRSPVDGIVNTLEVNTIGAYVDAGKVIAGVVPTADTLLIEAKISPRDVAFVRIDQPAVIKISAYDFSIFGALDGKVVNVSADSLVEKDKNETYYLVRIKTDKSALERDGKHYPIIPGMVASAEIMTGRKTILAYLMKPINKARSEALTER